MKYNFAITNEFGEKFEATGADSFDEAIKQVEKGVYHRKLELTERIEKYAAATQGAQTETPAAPEAPSEEQPTEENSQPAKKEEPADPRPPLPTGPSTKQPEAPPTED